MKIKRNYIIAIILLIQFITTAQISSNYTRFGIGEIVYSNSGRNLGFGGLGVSIANGNYISLINPASLTKIKLTRVESINLVVLSTILLTDIASIKLVPLIVLNESTLRKSFARLIIAFLGNEDISNQIFEFTTNPDCIAIFSEPTFGKLPLTILTSASGKKVKVSV